MDESLRQGAAVGYENVVVTDAIYPPRAAYLESLSSRTFSGTTAEVLDWVNGSQSLSPGDSAIKLCLLIVDLQNDIIHPGGSSNRYKVSKLTNEEREEIIRNNQKLAAAARSKGLPIVYIKSARGKDRFIDTASARMGLRKHGMEYRTEGTWGAEIVEEVKPQPTEYIVPKRGHSGFGTTHLHRMLRNLGVNLVVVTGGSVVGCVADTTREGIGLGYRMILIGDATYPPEKREIGLPALATRAEISTTEEILTRINNSAW